MDCVKSDTVQLTAIATGDTGIFDTETDKAAPVLAQVSAPTAGNKPSYGFSSTEAGAITYGGNCGNGSLENAASGDGNTTVFGGENGLAAGTYDCTITVADSETNDSAPLAVPQIVVQATGGGGGGGGGGGRRTSGTTGTYSMPTTTLPRN